MIARPAPAPGGLTARDVAAWLGIGTVKIGKHYGLSFLVGLGGLAPRGAGWV